MTVVNKIMLIDDDDISNFITERKIKVSGIAEKIVICNSGANALRLLNSYIQNAEDLPTIILLDINMPVMDGFGFLEEFTNLDFDRIKNIRIAMLTSSLEKEEVKKSYKYPQVIDFINKPLSEDKIRDIVKKINNLIS